MSAKKAIRAYCMWCTQSSYSEITKCPASDCTIWTFREGLTVKGESKQKAIRKKCADCNQTNRTGICKEKTCPLFPYRDGHRPVSEDHVKKVISPEQLAKMQAANPVRRRLIGSDEKRS
jgi:hypothetical protein